MFDVIRRSESAQVAAAYAEMQNHNRKHLADIEFTAPIADSLASLPSASRRMQNICHLSRRWHQQFCRSPSFSAHQKCLQRWYRPSLAIHSRQRPGPRPPPPKKATVIRQGDLVVREYEQDSEDHPETLRPIDHNDDPMVQEAQMIKAQILKLEEELKIMKQGPFGPNSEFMQSIPKDEREELLRELEAEGVTFDSLHDLNLEDTFDLDLEGQDIGLGLGTNEDERPLSVTMRIPDKHKVYVNHFNAALLMAKDKDDDLRNHLALWKWYLRCQQKVPGFSSFVDEDVWHFAWKSQMKVYPKTKHIIVLAKDMMTSDVELSLEQHLDYIDALHHTGDTATAIQVWEKQETVAAQRSPNGSAYKATSNWDPTLATRFWATGVRLFAAVGRPSKAQNIAFKTFESRHDTSQTTHDFDIFIDVIRAWAHSQKAEANVRLWACYLLLKERQFELTNGKPLSTKVLGEITSVLLNAGHRQMALAVFQDMLATHPGSRTASTSTFNRLMKPLGNTTDIAAAENIINQVGLAALIALPPESRNKYFFGAWIKWLIGENKVDDAALVVELMQEHGVKPDARHLNGIVGAWLRDGSSAARARAEQMAWAMIHARIDLVQSRSEDPNEAHATIQQDQPYADRRRLPVFLKRNIPPATIETFSVLLLHYTRQSDVPKATHLTDILTGPAQMRPNSFILNHWLVISLRASDLSALYTRYSSTKSDIEPDLETFAILWDGCRRNLDRASTARSPHYPTPRQLFLEMRSWYLALPASKQARVREDFIEDIYEQVIRCFCLHSDLRGTYVAVDQLKLLFGATPVEDVARMVIMQVARMAPTNSRQSHARRPAIKRHDSAYRSTLAVMANVLQAIHDNKGAELVDKGATADESSTPESKMQQECRLDAIKTFVVMICVRMATGSGDVVEEIRVAAKAMGVEVDREEIRWRRREGMDYQDM